MIQAFFSDIDGTLLNSKHRMTERTQRILQALSGKLHFALVSARSPSGIYPILERYHLEMSVISYSGAWIIDERRRLLFEQGMEQDTAEAVLDFVEQKRFDLTWNLYSGDRWLVADKSDARVRREEGIVEAEAEQGGIASLAAGEKVHKILCMCPPERILEIEQSLQEAFPALEIVKSSDILIEIMAGGVNKAEAVRFLCDKWQVPLADAVAFGDNYNDMEMLAAVGHGVAMGNAPAQIRTSAAYVTADNDHDGIAAELERVCGV